MADSTTLQATLDSDIKMLIALIGFVGVIAGVIGSLTTTFLREKFVAKKEKNNWRLAQLERLHEAVSAVTRDLAVKQAKYQHSLQSGEKLGFIDTDSLVSHTVIWLLIQVHLPAAGDCYQRLATAVRNVKLGEEFDIAYSHVADAAIQIDRLIVEKYRKIMGESSR